MGALKSTGMTESSSSKSKRRARRTGPSTGEKVRNILIGPVGALVLVAGLGGFAWFRQQQSQSDFERSVQQGQAALSSVETSEDLGQEHVQPGQPVTYDQEFPTSGPHDPTPVLAGFYRQEQRPEMLVHSLEHGNIVIYYDQPDAPVLTTLEKWTEQFPGVWDGVVAVPKAGLGNTVVLTAWTKTLKQETFDPEAAAAFIDQYRGRGPENPVR